MTEQQQITTVLRLRNPALKIFEGFPGVGKESATFQMVKNLPSMQETSIQSLGQEDPLEKGMATPSNILAWRIPWTEEVA